MGRTNPTTQPGRSDPTT